MLIELVLVKGDFLHGFLQALLHQSKHDGFERIAARYPAQRSTSGVADEGCDLARMKKPLQGQAIWLLGRGSPISQVRARSQRFDPR